MFNLRKLLCFKLPFIESGGGSEPLKYTGKYALIREGCETTKPDFITVWDEHSDGAVYACFLGAALAGKYKHHKSMDYLDGWLRTGSYSHHAAAVLGISQMEAKVLESRYQDLYHDWLFTRRTGPDPRLQLVEQLEREEAIA